jgi:hypothetical protein
MLTGVFQGVEEALIRLGDVELIDLSALLSKIIINPWGAAGGYPPFELDVPPPRGWHEPWLWDAVTSSGELFTL